jgi:integrase
MERPSAFTRAAGLASSTFRRSSLKDLRQLPGGLKGMGRLFSFHAGGRLRDLLKMTLAEAGVVLPRRVAFHVFCHTWATWMRQHGGLDTFDLVRTDRWADPESADRYAHVVVSEQARRADLLPGAKKAAG